MNFRLFSLALVAACVLADGVVDLTADNFADTTKDGFWLVKFYAPWCGHCKKMAPTWDYLGEQLAGKANIAKIDCTQHKDKCGEFGVKGFPTIKLLKNGEEFEIFKGARTASAFVDFLKEKAELAKEVIVANLPGTDAPPKREAAPPAAAEPEGPTDVVNLSAADVEKLEGDWLVKFYAPWCGHCKRLAPTWSHLATELKGKANIAKVDCTVEKEVCSKYGITGYPTLKLLSGKEEKAPYSGGRDPASLLAFLKEQGVVSADTQVKPLADEAPKRQPAAAAPAEAENTDVNVLTDATFDASIKEGYSFVKFYAPWCGHCKKLAPAWDHLATELKGKANIAKVDCTVQKTVCGAQGVRGYPTLKLFKDGEEVEKYQSGRDVDSMVRYLKEKGALDASVTVKPMGAPKREAPAAKKDEPKADEKTNIVVLGADDFASKTASGSWFVKFYAPWCGHCKRLAPVWEELATEYNKAGTPVQIAKVDCTVHQAICKEKGVSGYPTLQLITDGGEGEGYRGGRDLSALSKFLADKGLNKPTAGAKHTEL